MSQKAIEVLPRVLRSMHADTVNLKGMVGLLQQEQTAEFTRVSQQLTQLDDKLDRMLRLLEGTTSQPGVLARVARLEEIVNGT